jgi:hypothetical protein
MAEEESVMADDERRKRTARVGRWRLMFRRGRYRWAAERRPVGTYVLATRWFIFTALRRFHG